MSTILVTGASGRIGRALTESLAAKHRVLAMSRHRPAVQSPHEYIPGEFHCFEDLRRLDSLPIDTVVHLAAVTGGCHERHGFLVNVEGTRCLLRYLVDRGCRKFVLASSIAAPGTLDPNFCPLRFPIPDDHPCHAIDGYGLSKYMMEELSKYFSRQNPAIDIINLRLAAVFNDADFPQPYKIQPGQIGTIVSLTRMFLSDAVRVFTLAAESPHKPGVRIFNATAEKAAVTDPIPDILRAWHPGAALDLTYYERPGHERDSLFDITRARDELGFVGRDVIIPG